MSACIRRRPARSCGGMDNMMSTRLAFAAAALLTLSACGGGDGPPDVEGLADDAGCSGFEQDTEMAMVREAGSCTVDGEDVWLYTFSDGDQQDTVAEVSRGGGGVWVVGDLWEIQAPSADLAEQIADATGGKVE